MTHAALARIMVSRRAIIVASLAVGKTSMVKLNLSPRLGAQVTSAALTQIVIGGTVSSVTALAIDLSGMAEVYLSPI